MLNMKRMLESECNKRECPALNIPLLNTCMHCISNESHISIRIVKVFFVNYDSIVHS